MPLRPGQIDLWLCGSDAVAAETLDAWAALLDPSDLASVDRLVRPELRRDRLVSRAFVRILLADYSGRPPESLRFARRANGRPELLDVPHLAFSVSHTEGLVACAVAAGGELGVDVERLRAADLTETVGLRFFAPAEVARLRALAGDARRLAFFEQWVLKEAYAKAVGRGISLGFGTFSIFVADGEARLERPDHDDGAGWWLALVEPGPRHRLGLAYRGPGDAPELTVRWSADCPLRGRGRPRVLAATRRQRPTP